MLLQTYLMLKAVWSYVTDRLFAGAPRKPLPAFLSPVEVSSYLQRYAVYTGDPLNGAADFYTAPEVFQAAMELGQQVGKDLAFQKLNVHIDCDDYAGYAYVACKRIKGCTVRLITLLDANLFGSHVITVGLYNGQYFAIDTNGFRYLPDWSAQTLCSVWTDVYKSRGYHYIDAEESLYPFDLAG